MRVRTPQARARRGAGADARALADRHEHHVGRSPDASWRRTPASRWRRRAPGRRGTRAPCARRVRRPARRRARVRPGSRRRARSARRRARASRRSSRPSCRAARRWSRPGRGARAAKAIDWPWLPRVALITRAHGGLAPAQCVEVDQPAAHLEGADRRVVLVLDPDLRAQALRRAAASAAAAWAACARAPVASAAFDLRSGRLDGIVSSMELALGARRARPATCGVDSVARRASGGAAAPTRHARPAAAVRRRGQRADRERFEPHAAGRQAVARVRVRPIRSASAARRRTGARRRRAR